MARILTEPATSKTGVVLKDSGARDEHGMQPLDDLFSSPEKGNRNGTDEDDDESDEEPMDIDEGEFRRHVRRGHIVDGHLCCTPGQYDQ